MNAVKSDFENTLLDIYEECIGTKDIDRKSPFLDIGGNSINVVKVLRNIEVRTNVKLSTEIFFDDSTSTFEKVLETISEANEEI